MLSDLLKLAADNAFLRNDWIENRQGWAMLLARERQSMEISRKMHELGLSQMAIPDEEPVPTAEELAYDWVGPLPGQQAHQKTPRRAAPR